MNLGGSVIDIMLKKRQRACDGNSEEYGTVEHRVMLKLNGPPSGYRNNNKLLVHALQSLHGMHYASHFYTKSKLSVVSKVQQHLTEGTHDQGRNIASSRVIPCFQI